MVQLKENSAESAIYMTYQMHKEIKKFRETEPFHAASKCQDHRCVWHYKRKQ
jgi:hypothetical protein